MSKAPINFMRLIERSPDRGDGWRTVSDALWPTVAMHERDYPDLFETDAGHQVRLKPEALTILKWI